MKKTRALTAIAATLILSLGITGCGQTSVNTKILSNAETSQNNSSSEKLIIAHRGASGYLPEHTLEAYSMAYALGADYIEADVNVTKDGQLVVMHDTHLDTTTNVAELFPDRKREDGRYYIVDFTLEEIKQLSVHERRDLKNNEAVFGDRFPTNYTSEFKVPTLEEEIQLIQGLNKSTGRNVGIYPELKFPDFYTENGFDIGKLTLDLLEKYGYNTEDSKCYIQCFNPTYLKNFHDKLNPKVKLVQLIGDSSWDDNKGDDIPYMLSTEGIKEIATYADGIGPRIEQIFDEDGKQKASDLVLNPNIVSDAHNVGLQVHPYTVRKDDLPSYVKDTNEFIRKLLFEAKVDGVFTDFTDLGVQAKNDGPINK